MPDAMRIPAGKSTPAWPGVESGLRYDSEPGLTRACRCCRVPKKISGLSMRSPARSRAVSGTSGGIPPSSICGRPSGVVTAARLATAPTPAT
jgi:hypothetical protein